MYSKPQIKKIESSTFNGKSAWGCSPCRGKQNHTVY